MSIPTTATPDVCASQADAPLLLAVDLQQAAHTDLFDGVVTALQQRDLLEPCLLLSAGYVGAPFFLHQALLLLSPVLALLGLPLRRQEEQNAVPQ